MGLCASSTTVETQASQKSGKARTVFRDTNPQFNPDGTLFFISSDDNALRDALEVCTLENFITRKKELKKKKSLFD